MSTGQKLSLGEPKDPAMWFNTFFRALEGIEIPWISTYKLLKREKIEEGKISYREVANSFRAEYIAALPATRRKTPAKGSFPTTFAGEKAPDDQESTSPVPPATTSSKRRKRSQISSPTRLDVRCIGCGQFGHDLPNCFYAFPEKAGSDWVPRDHRKRTFERNSKKAEVQKELARLKNKKARTEEAQDNQE